MIAPEGALSDLKAALKRVIAAAHGALRPASGGCRDLLCHSVSSSPSRDADQMTVPVGLFSEQLRLLQDRSFTVRTVDSLVQAPIAGRPPADRSVANALRLNTCERS